MFFLKKVFLFFALPCNLPCRIPFGSLPALAANGIALCLHVCFPLITDGYRHTDTLDLVG